MIFICALFMLFSQYHCVDDDIDEFFTVYHDTGKESSTESNRKIIKLDESNFVTIRGKIDEESASAFVTDINKIKGNKIYIYLLTPGGSIISGNTIMQHIEALTLNGKKIYCIADHAYSMGFVIFQACPTRYVMEHSIIMQHQPSLSVGGPIEQARNRFKLVEKIEKKNNEVQAKRLNLTIEEFHKIYVHDAWFYSDEILTMNAADEMVSVLCNFNVDKTQTLTMNTFFGSLKLLYSLCPLIHTPKNITFVMDTTILNKSIDNKYQELVNDYDVTKFIKNLI